MRSEATEAWKIIYYINTLLIWEAGQDHTERDWNEDPVWNSAWYKKLKQVDKFRLF